MVCKIENISVIQLTLQNPPSFPSRLIAQLLAAGDAPLLRKAEVSGSNAFEASNSKFNDKY